MITGSSAWNTAVGAEQKTPLYVLEIPAVVMKISSFLPSDTLAVYATSALVFTAQPAAGDTVTIGILSGASSPIVYTFRTSVSAAYDVAIGSNLTTTIENLLVAITAGAGAGTAYGTGTSAHPSVTALEPTANSLVVQSTTIGQVGQTITVAASTAASVAAWTFSTLLTALPTLQIPQGAGQTVTETQGQSSLSQLSCKALDAGGGLIVLASNQSLLGAACILKLGFPGMAYSNFVSLFSGILTSMGRSSQGVMSFTVADTQKTLISQVWLNGGPTIPAIKPLGGAYYYGTTSVSSVNLSALELESYSGFALAIVVVVVLYGTAVSVSGITDTAGNAYTKAAAGTAPSGGSGVRTEIWTAFPCTENLSNIIAIALTGGSTIVNAFAEIYENVLGVGVNGTNTGASSYPGEGVGRIAKGNLACVGIGWLSEYTPASPSSDQVSALSGKMRIGGAAASSQIDGGLIDSYSDNIVAGIYNGATAASRTWAAAGVILEGQANSDPSSDKNPAPYYDNAVADNGQQILDSNVRYVYGHPLNILLAVLQNELGLGQNPALGPAILDQTDGSGGTETVVFGPSSSWVRFAPGDDTTLINPNPYLDVDGVIALRQGEFANERMEFVMTRAVTAKSWLEDQILKPLGLYFVHGSDGKLRLKSMSFPQAQGGAAWQASHSYTMGQTIVDPAGHIQRVTVPGSSGSSAPSFNDAGGTTTDNAVTWTDMGLAQLVVDENLIVGIPEVTRLPVINFITARSQVDNTERETAARDYGFDETYMQYTSIKQYQQQFTSAIESDGLRSGIGSGVRSFLTADRTFKRRAFGTPSYEFTALFATMILELGDFIVLSHPQLADFITGKIGVSNVLCEVYDRQPSYAKGTMKYKVMDTRSFGIPAALPLVGTAVLEADSYTGASNRVW